MRPLKFAASSLLLILTLFSLHAQTGPFSPEDWPGSRQANKKVHYVVTDDGLAPPSDTWTPDLSILTGGDQITGAITIGGHDGLKVLASHLNIADANYGEWADDEFIDILVQAYGDAGLFNADGTPRNFNFLLGTLPELVAPNGGQVPVEAKNKKWNWILFRVPNDFRPSDNSRYVGSIPANAQGDTRSGGVNGGTIRLQDVPGLTVRVVAFGELGAFGEPEAVNLFVPTESCDPEPPTNLVGLDINAGVTNQLVVLNDQDQTVTAADGIGPANDKRRAVRPNGTFLNFGITGNYLGLPCNDPRAIKVCVEFYDDPAFAGQDVRFGPEAYATDATGGVGIYPSDRRQVLTGSGQWIKRSWVLPSVNLKGVNAGTLTAGPRFISENGSVYVSRIDLAVLRIGTHPQAGIDPLQDCFEDPNICTDAYGNQVELDLMKEIHNGLDVGSSGGDQEMIQAEAGPAGDRRAAIRPAREDGTPGFAHTYLNFAITGEALGPSSQPPAHLAICVTYYDDPNLLGARFKPEVYKTDQNGLSVIKATPESFFVTLEGTDTWRTAYWEIPDVKFDGVNQGPQAAARFVLSDKIFFTRVRYAVIRPCGPKAGKNALEECKPLEAPTLSAVLAGSPLQLELRWPVAAAGFTVESTPSLSATDWQPVTDAVVVEGTNNVLRPHPTETVFYRLVHP